MASEYGRLVQDWGRMNYYEPVFVPRGLDEPQLVHHTRKAYRTFYLKPRTIIAYLKRVRSAGHLLYLVKSFLALLRYAVLPGAKGAQTDAGRTAASATHRRDAEHAEDTPSGGHPTPSKTTDTSIIHEGHEEQR